MAWRCSSESNEGLISNLVDSRIIQSSAVEHAMKAVDRKNYAPRNYYSDSPQYIGHEATISAPHMHAHALSLLESRILQPNSRILDVGCGSGYLAVCIARMAPEGGKVFGVDYLPQLVELSHQNTCKSDKDLLDSGKLEYVTTDGWKGLPHAAPFDAIHVGAAATSIPSDLVRQLKVGGVMVIPVGPAHGEQYLLKVERTNDNAPFEQSYRTQTLMGVRYVPLVDTGGEVATNTP
eukprot:CAMPEP_0113934976 /NCGR_PEP_ID=MMETSP1339-20121228/2226_1 /TAXON_ID=94617 /ORGANISM="Fibrocapsa japonica" /LENGTH=234 /DNA_ID=CAMNT_0000936985 /DNA_START=70 /DNA_END=774 /DNA_ORIENTATION=- /assembly_acc=CAM_ASM_000762